MHKVTNTPLRREILLDGLWELSQSETADQHGLWQFTVPVPGLVDLAQPALPEVGVVSELRSFFWYRTHFATPHEPAPLARLKIWKVQFGHSVVLNGTEVGGGSCNFTSACYDVTNELAPAGGENELLIRIGADPTQLPRSVVYGHDFEKLRYIPGIYDSVSLILSGRPAIWSIQVAPNLASESIQLAVECEHVDTEPVRCSYTLTSPDGKILAGEVEQGAGVRPATIPIPRPQPWSPEEPALYRIDISTVGDTACARFGMRDFSFDPVRGQAILNGSTYFLRGTNICFHRFLEDSSREALPWDQTWVRRLFELMKELHWNSFRFCLGFPPEFWYEIADETGFLIQDEYPIWYGPRPELFPKELSADVLANEYRGWMRDRWNHPSVVIWDAQNETVTEKTGAAIRAVRSLDLSDRPWDNGYGAPGRLSDPIEVHPYILQNYMSKPPGDQGPLYDYLTRRRIPDNGPNEFSPRRDGEPYTHPIVNNENVFFWLNRDGTPTGLTRSIYENVGDHTNLTTEDLHAYYYQRIISYWRVHRTSAAVHEFAFLGYSRPGDSDFTSDNFRDVASLALRSTYVSAVRAAFHPIGLMIDRWESFFVPDAEIVVPIRMINDRANAWMGAVVVELAGETGPLPLAEEAVSIAPFGTYAFEVQMRLPGDSGDYLLTAGFADNGESIMHEHRFSIDPLPRLAEPVSGSPSDQYVHSVGGVTKPGDGA